MSKIEIYDNFNSLNKFSVLRRDIVDRNGVIISRNINSFHVAINPKQVKDKNKYLLDLLEKNIK